MIQPSKIVRMACAALMCMAAFPVLAQTGKQLPPEALEQMKKMQQMQGAPAAGAVQMPPKPTLFSEPQLVGFLGAAKELRTLGEEAGGWSEPGNAEATAKGMQLSAQAQTILGKHGFKNAGDFQQVGYNAALAYAVLEKGGKDAVVKELGKSQAQQAKALEQMRQHMGAEQAAAMQAQMAAGMAMAESLKEVPDQNITLVTKYRDQLKALESQPNGR